MNLFTYTVDDVMANLNHAPDLYENFKRLQESNAHVRQLILSSTGEIYLPHTFKVIGDPRVCVANALTELWFYAKDKNRIDGEDKSSILNAPYSGLLCASSELITAVEELNSIKQDFKRCIVALRDEDKKKKVKFQFTGYIKNDPLYQEAMRRAGISGLNLTACYRQIRVLDQNLHSVRWIWQRNPKSVEKRRVKDLLDSLGNNAYGGKPDIRGMLQRILSSMNPTDYVAEVKSKNPKLRANLTYLAEGANYNLAERKSIACSGILLTPGEHLPPNIAWKDKPVPLSTEGGALESSIKERWTTESIVEDQPFVKETKLHFYKPGHMPVDGDK